MPISDGGKAAVADAIRKHRTSLRRRQTFYCRRHCAGVSDRFGGCRGVKMGDLWVENDTGRWRALICVNSVAGAGFR